MRRPIGIMAAMPEEIDGLVARFESRTTHTEGMREYHQGLFHGTPVVTVYARWGKVAAAATATHLILRHGVQEVVFTGVAGAVAPGIRIGDIVIGTSLVQHDLDARPLFDRHEIPLLGRTRLDTHESARNRLLAAARNFVSAGLPGVTDPSREAFGLQTPQILAAGIASGDQFFREQAAIGELLERLPDVACVEMEGAAVAQVCHEYGVPFSLVRTISDGGNESAPLDFPRFVREVASQYSLGILDQLFQLPR